MNSVADYDECIRAFLATCDILGDRIVSVILYGSGARGAIRPGISDILDVVVILQDSVFDDRSIFGETISVFAKATEELASCGLPFHPFQYYSLSEIRSYSCSLFHGDWKLENRTRILKGLDIRSEIGIGNAPDAMLQATFLGVRRTVQRAVRLIGVNSSSKNASAVKFVNWFLKDVFKLAAIACYREVLYPDSLSAARVMFPDVDFSRLDRIISLYETSICESDEVDTVIADAIRLNEDLQRAVSRIFEKSGKTKLLLNECQPWSAPDSIQMTESI